MMTRKHLEKYINNNELMNEASHEKLKETATRYPYFHTAHLLLAKNRYQLNPHEFERHIHEASAFCAERKRLFYLINSEKYRVFFEADETVIDTDRTETLLSSFLSEFIEEDEKERTIGATDNIIATDYLTYLEKTSSEKENKTDDDIQPSLKHQSIIDDFLEKAESNEVLFTPSDSSSKSIKTTDTEEKPESGGFLTETLARIYIKQKKYEQALTIIQQLSLNFPKKSSYFADQIRFLELLILNEKNKKQ